MDQEAVVLHRDPVEEDTLPEAQEVQRSSEAVPHRLQMEEEDIHPLQEAQEAQE